jgi:hypothetical protein
MDYLFQILVITVPSAVVLIVAVQMMKERDEKLAKSNGSTSNGSTTKPQVNFQAYERLVLYLERSNPINMVMRMNRPGINAKMLEGEMVKSIREEFEHNLSQQIYVSDDIWKLIKQAKEETIKLISLASSRCTEKQTGMDLSKILLELAGAITEFPHDVAIRYLKQELRSKL